MPVTVEWKDLAKSIVYYRFEGAWRWDELYPVFDQALAMEHSVPHRVDVIIDMLASKRVPSGALSHVKIIANRQPSNLCLSVFVSKRTFISVLLKTVQRLHKGIARDYRMTDSIDDAYRLIMADRSQARAS